MKGRPVVFVPSADPKRAAKWYATRLGMKHVADEAYASVVRDGDITIRLSLVEGVEPAPFTILGWEVKDLARAMRTLKAKKVKTIRYPGMAQDKEGVWKSPGGARVVWFHDRDGNVLSLTERGGR
jgi:catechol 2,3-dioxygenase-like lactoylglutathione lyase family enzyme